MLATNVFYDQYCENIRKEFKAFPDFIFRQGRRSFLKSQLKLPLIFHTTTFRNKYEVQAPSEYASGNA